MPGLQGLTRLSLALDPWPEADDTAAGERMLCNWACVSTAALQRSLEHLAALQVSWLGRLRGMNLVLCCKTSSGKSRDASHPTPPSCMLQ